jgi:hypothetical protein
MRWIAVRDPPWNQNMISEAGRMKLNMTETVWKTKIACKFSIVH